MKVSYIISSKFLTVMFWMIITIAAFLLYRKESTSAVIQYNSTQDFEIYISDKLKWLISPDSNKVGHADLIMSLNDTLGRHVTDIWLTEGELDTQKINPYNVWKKLLRGTNAIIVNSPDEKFTCHSTSTGTLVANICRGCNLAQVKNEIKTPGEVVITKCEGPYHDNGLFNYVANAIVANQKYLDSAFNEVNLPYVDGPQAVWKENLQKCISNIFKAYRENAAFFPGSREDDALVFNAIGTYHARVPLDFLYAHFFRVLDSVYRENQKLPGKIFINLYRKQIQDDSRVIYYSLKDGFKLLRSNSGKLEIKRHETEWLELAGLSLGILILIFSAKYFVRFRLLKYSEQLLKESLFLSMLGHFCLGYGFLQLIQKIPQVDLLLQSQNSTVLYLVMGIFAIPLSFIIPLARNTTKQD